MTTEIGEIFLSNTLSSWNTTNQNSAKTENFLSHYVKDNDLNHTANTSINYILLGFLASLRLTQRYEQFQVNTIYASLKDDGSEFYLISHGNDQIRIPFITGYIVNADNDYRGRAITKSVDHLMESLRFEFPNLFEQFAHLLPISKIYYIGLLPSISCILVDQIQYPTNKELGKGSTYFAKELIESPLWLDEEFNKLSSRNFHTVSSALKNILVTTFRFFEHYVNQFNLPISSSNAAQFMYGLLTFSFQQTYKIGAKLSLSGEQLFLMSNEKTDDDLIRRMIVVDFASQNKVAKYDPDYVTTIMARNELSVVDGIFVQIETTDNAITLERMTKIFKRIPSFVPFLLESFETLMNENVFYNEMTATLTKKVATISESLPSFSMLVDFLLGEMLLTSSRVGNYKVTAYMFRRDEGYPCDSYAFGLTDINEGNREGLLIMIGNATEADATFVTIAPKLAFQKGAMVHIRPTFRGGEKLEILQLTYFEQDNLAFLERSKLLSFPSFDVDDFRQHLHKDSIEVMKYFIELRQKLAPLDNNIRLIAMLKGMLVDAGYLFTPSYVRNDGFSIDISTDDNPKELLIRISDNTSLCNDFASADDTDMEWRYGIWDHFVMSFKSHKSPVIVCWLTRDKFGSDNGLNNSATLATFGKMDRDKPLKKRKYVQADAQEIDNRDSNLSSSKDSLSESLKPESVTKDNVRKKNRPYNLRMKDGKRYEKMWSMIP